MLVVHFISAIFQFTHDIHVALLILVHLHSNVCLSSHMYTRTSSVFKFFLTFDTSFTIKNCINVTVRKDRSFMIFAHDRSKYGRQGAEN